MCTTPDNHIHKGHWSRVQTRSSNDMQLTVILCPLMSEMVPRKCSICTLVGKGGVQIVTGQRGRQGRGGGLEWGGISKEREGGGWFCHDVVPSCGILDQIQLDVLLWGSLRCFETKYLLLVRVWCMYWGLGWDSVCTGFHLAQPVWLALC